MSPIPGGARHDPTTTSIRVAPVTNSPIAIYPAASDRVPVWDRLVRAFHWSLVAAVAVALATGFLESGSLLNVHIAAGVVILALVVLRVIWGFTGSTYARFNSFVVSPAALIRYVDGLRRGEVHAHVGHNPAGGWMILALLTTLTLLGASGLVVLGGTLKDGPLAPFVSFANGRAVKEVHELLAFALIGLVSLHVIAVVVESLRMRDNLVAAMVRGWKLERADVPLIQVARPRPALAAAITGGCLLLGGAAYGGLSRLPVPGLPSQPLDAVYAKECGSCHSPHHPSVAASATWEAVLRGLDGHFGENASLEQPVTRSLAAYLAANSAEHWDTQAANRLVKPDAREPLRITATDGWKRLHRRVPAAVFERNSVGGSLNCSRCHRDAEAGRFDPRAIAIPEEKTAR